MATAPEEMADLARVAGALLVNFGTIQNLDGMLAAGEYALPHTAHSQRPTLITCPRTISQATITI